jgi:hypothetical protein
VSEVRTVGHDEQSLASVAWADFLRAEYSRRNAVAQSFQCRDDDAKLSVCVPRHVFAEDTTRPALCDDPDDMVEQPAAVVFAEPFSGNAVGLARVAANDAIHDSTPRSSIEGSNVRPDRSRMKESLLHARHQSGGSRCFPLQVTDCHRSGFCKHNPEVEPSDAGTDGEDVPGT